MKIVFSEVFPKECIEKIPSFHTIVMPKMRFTHEELLAECIDADAIIDARQRVSKDIIEGTKRLRVFGTCSVGYDHIDVPACLSRNITVINTPQAVMHATAEIAVALIFDVCRRISFYDRTLRKELKWSMPFFVEENMSLQGRVLGIVGMGRIGQTTARMLKACGMRIVYSSTRRIDAAQEAELDATYVSFDELLTQADIVSLHCPYRAENHQMMNAAAFAKMKSSAYFINTARGKLVDEQALLAALKEKRICGAGLDVFENEPKLDPAFASLDNVVVLPHIGTTAKDVRIAMGHEIIDGVLVALRGEVPPNIVVR